MTRIYFWGDSWASPTKIDIVKATNAGHSFNLLKQYGYDLTNFAADGAGNFHSIHASRHAPEPDYLVWFHTEMLRDLDLMVNKFNLFDCPWYIENGLHAIAKKIYELAAEQLDRWPNTKLILLQGQSPVVDPEFSHLIQPFVMKNWRYDLYSDEGKKLDPCYFLSTYHKIKSGQILDSAEEKKKIIDLVDRHYVEMSANLYYPDNGHPSDVAHRELVNYLLKVFDGGA